MTTPWPRIYTYTDLSDDEYTFLIQEDNVDVIEHTMEMSIEMDEMGMADRASCPFGQD
jgi:hypothetical protein